ncbi:hypothetical protein IWX49DRAFT_106832 [Phyllosticta citricarpa]|uniref:Uncharacterized protein n=2 Tax=Phyllosticta TaxID=121621 RepID=A0ABR1MHM9_9PEZI
MYHLVCADFFPLLPTQCHSANPVCQFLESFTCLTSLRRIDSLTEIGSVAATLSDTDTGHSACFGRHQKSRGYCNPLVNTWRVSSFHRPSRSWSEPFHTAGAAKCSRTEQLISFEEHFTMPHSAKRFMPERAGQMRKMALASIATSTVGGHEIRPVQSELQERYQAASRSFYEQ